MMGPHAGAMSATSWVTSQFLNLSSWVSHSGINLVDATMLPLSEPFIDVAEIWDYMQLCFKCFMYCEHVLTWDVWNGGMPVEDFWW